MALLISTSQRIVEELQREEESLPTAFVVRDVFSRLDPVRKAAFIKGLLACLVDSDGASKIMRASDVKTLSVATEAALSLTVASKPKKD